MSTSNMGGAGEHQRVWKIRWSNLRGKQPPPSQTEDCEGYIEWTSWVINWDWEFNGIDLHTWHGYG